MARPSGAASSSGPGSSASARPTGLDIGNEAPSWQTIVPTPAWRKKTFKSDWDKAWNPGDSIQLAIGQKDVTVTPLQMARFYAMIANGGKLVTPVRRLRRRAAGLEPAAARHAAAVPARRRRATRASTRPRCRRCATGLWAATHSTNGTSSGVFGTYPISISGKTGTAEKVVNLPGYPVGHLEDQSWWCGYGPSDDAAARRLRRDRERRPRLLGGRARRRSASSRSTSTARPAPRHW